MHPSTLCVCACTHTYTWVLMFWLWILWRHSGHPWFRICTDCSTSGDSTANCSNLLTASYISKGAPGIIPNGRRWHKSSLESYDGESSQVSHDGARCVNIDALTARISRIDISEPKRSRICGPVPAPSGLDLKTNLCTAFWPLTVVFQRWEGFLLI
jgi:hypothetical protein